jgi:hypothetical protein
MSQVFAADSVTASGSVTVPTTSETPLVKGNFLSPPFQNAKVIVMGLVQINPGAGTTGLTLRVRRNPGAENLEISPTTGFQLTPAGTITISCMVADVIPDGRAVQYQLTLQQTGASGNGIVASSAVTALLISG